MKVGMSVVSSGMKSETANRAVIRPRDLKRILAITRPPVMHRSHCRPTAPTVKTTEFTKLRTWITWVKPEKAVRVVAEMK